jgi:hypothetical protein
MHRMIELIVLAGIGQLGLAGVNFILPRILRPSTELAPVSPMIRKMFYVHWIYIVFVLLIFSELSLFLPANWPADIHWGDLFARRLLCSGLRACRYNFSTMTPNFAGCIVRAMWLA